jgi:multidrug resistance efflux pump
MRGELAAARSAVQKAVDAVKAAGAEVEKLADAIEGSEQYVLDLDSRADRRRSLESELHRLQDAVVATTHAHDEAKKRYDSFLASLPNRG